MGMFIHATDESGDNYWDTIEMVEKHERNLTQQPDEKSWKQACDELNIVAPSVRDFWENLNG